jgi:hypothetical protein
LACVVHIKSRQHADAVSCGAVERPRSLAADAVQVRDDVAGKLGLDDVRDVRRVEAARREVGLRPR